MTTLEAHGTFASRIDRAICPVDLFVAGPDGEPVDVWPAAMTAVCVLTGWLEDCHTDADLDEAVQHYGVCSVNIGLFTTEDFAEALKGVLTELMLWGESVTTAGGIGSDN